MPVHVFVLIHCPVDELPPRFEDPRYDAIKAAPPAGCVPADFDGMFGMNCRREAPRLLDAVREVCAEVRAEHGFLLNDLGVEKLWEWSGDGTDGYGAAITGQLLLMAAHRAGVVGYTVDDLVSFLQTVAPPPPTEAPQPAP